MLFPLSFDICTYNPNGLFNEGTLCKSNQTSSQRQEATHIAEKFCLTSPLIPDSDCNSTLSAGIYFSPIICLQFRQYCLFYCKMQEL